MIQNQPDFYAMKGATVKDIELAEKNLKLRFADDYRQYIETFSVVSFNGHELTGICKYERLNVVNVTLEERNRNDNIPNDWYVVEQTNIDGIVIWQIETGFIYQTAPNLMPKKICNSLAEYIELF